MGDGRYIQLGQKIHLSVIKRALYDRAVEAGTTDAGANHEPYPPIHAHLPPVRQDVGGLPRTWSEALQPPNVNRDSWEVVAPASSTEEAGGVFP